MEDKSVKKMFFAICVILLFSSVATAQEIDWDALTDEQRAQLVLEAEKMKAQNIPSVVSELENFSPERINEWVQLGQNIALAFTTVAKELGVTADEFLKTNTGKITIALIVWQVMGADMLGFLGGAIWWIVLANIILWSFRYFHMTKKVKDKEGGVSHIRRFEFSGDDAPIVSVAMHVIAFAIITIVCMLIMFPGS